MRSLPEPEPRSRISDQEELRGRIPDQPEGLVDEELQGLPKNLEQDGLLEEDEDLGV